jgi:hypothetical protein
MTKAVTTQINKEGKEYTSLGMLTAGDTSKVIVCPTKPDLSKRVYGDLFDANDLHYIIMRDPQAHFIVSTMSKDACRNGYVYETDTEPTATEDMTSPDDVDEELPARKPAKKPENPGEEYEPALEQFLEFKRGYGTAFMLFLDGDTSDLAKTIQNPVGIKAYPPYNIDDGGVAHWDLDPATGLPAIFYIRVPGVADEFAVAASRVYIGKEGNETVGWQGYTALGPMIDYLIGKHLWHATSMRRSRDYATIRYILTKAMGKWSTNEKAAAADAFTDIPHLLVDGNGGDVSVNPVGGPVQPEELALNIDQADKMIAAGAGVAQSDITGSQAGAKLSTDADTATYAIQIKDIQIAHYKDAKEIFKRLGIKITGMNPPGELPAEQKLTGLVTLCDLYTRAAPSVQEGVAQLLQNFMSSEFNIDIEVDVAGDQQAAQDLLETMSNGRPGENEGDSGSGTKRPGKAPVGKDPKAKGKGKAFGK